MLDAYNLRIVGPDAGPRFVEVPLNHPALQELLEANERPVGATGRLWTASAGADEGVYLFTLDAWERVAARQKAHRRRANPNRGVPPEEDDPT